MKMKDILLLVLIAIILNVACYWAIHQGDKAYETRAKLAGYELPLEQARNQPKMALILICFRFWYNDMIYKCPRYNEELEETSKYGEILLHCPVCGLYIEKQLTKQKIYDMIDMQ